MLPAVIIALIVRVVLALAAGWWKYVYTSRSTKLRKTVKNISGQRRVRVLVLSRRLRAKLWFEPSSRAKGAFDVHFQGDDDGFTVSSAPGEPIHIREARDVLNEFGLDLEKCLWQDILDSAE